MDSQNKQIDPTEQQSRANLVLIVLLPWAAFLITFCLVAAAIIGPLVIRAKSSPEVAGALISLQSPVLFVSLFLGLVVSSHVRRCLLRRSGVAEEALPKSGCSLLALPAAAIAFFCTCAPIGLVAIGKSTVPQGEAHRGGAWMMAAWLLGLLSAVAFGFRDRRDRSRKLEGNSPGKPSGVDQAMKS
jgi:hypothetical protein